MKRCHGFNEMLNKCFDYACDTERFVNTLANIFCDLRLNVVQTLFHKHSKHSYVSSTSIIRIIEAIHTYDAFSSSNSHLHFTVFISFLISHP